METSHILRFAMFWDLTQRRILVRYGHFGSTFPSHIQGSNSLMDCLTFVDGTDRFSRSVGREFIVSSTEFPNRILATLRLCATFYSK